MLRVFFWLSIGSSIGCLILFLTGAASTWPEWTYWLGEVFRHAFAALAFAVIRERGGTDALFPSREIAAKWSKP